MYPYVLGCHLKSGRLCRILEPIPQGFVKIIKYRDRVLGPGGYSRVSTYVRNPYSLIGELKPEYWTLPRDSDFEILAYRINDRITQILKERLTQ